MAEADLDHPSIVRVLGAGVEGTLAYSANEYVAAESLDIALRHYAPAALDMVLPFITQLAGAIDFARAAGIGHGALHPRDIFVTPDEARATGFGVVQALEATGVRAPVRRPYTAPERVDGGPWDVTADVYSLGAIAFELLTGRRPVGADNGPLGTNAGPHADEIARVISRALADDPARRYPSALAFAAALEASSRGERTTAAIEEVQAVAEAGLIPVATGTAEQPAQDVHELNVEPEPDDVAAEREADLVEIQLREPEPPHAETRDERPVPGPPLPKPTPIVEPTGAPPLTFFPEEPPERDDSFGDERTGRDAEFDRSLFDSEQESENGIPEVQHSGFTPGLLEPGYQSEPPPPEGWDAHPPVPSERRGAGRDEHEWELGPAPGAPQARAEEIRRVAPAGAVPQRRSVVLPVAITLLLGLFVGFLAGYLVFVRDGGAGAGTAPATDTANVSSTPQTSAPAEPPPSGRPQERAPARASSAAPKPAPATAAPRAAQPAGADNVEFLEGTIESLPLPASSVDVVISNCVINLSADKQRVFSEIARVLRPGGRLGVSDIVAEDRLTPADRAERGSYVGCIAGALAITEFEDGLHAAGLEDVSVSTTHAVADGMHAAIIRARKPARAAA